MGCYVPDFLAAFNSAYRIIKAGVSKTSVRHFHLSRSEQFDELIGC
jgi:hypothetical protein